MVSPVTGRAQVYTETIQNYVVPHQYGTVTPDQLRTEVDTQLVAQGVDGYCENVILVQSVLTDHYQVVVWAASEQTLDLDGKIVYVIAPLIIVAIIVAISLAVTILGLAYMTFSFLAEMVQTIKGPRPRYWNPDSPDVPFESFSEYYTRQTANYWYVCPKCGAGFGSKNVYPNVEDVPEAEVQAFEDHKADCLGLPRAEEEWIGGYIVIGAVVLLALGGMWLLGQAIAR